jgi:hypothetical protein
VAKSVVRFPAYRQFSDARVEINDAMMALMIGARLGEHTLSNSPAAPEALLPSLFGRIRSIKRLNRTAADAAILLEAAEGHLVYMAIPYALALHGVYVVAVAGMVRSDGHDEVDQQTSHPYQNDLYKLPLDIAHEYVEDRCEGHLSPELLALFHLSRRIRNRIVHAGGAVGSRLLGDYRNLPGGPGLPHDPDRDRSRPARAPR